jgi:hypothetical protein
VTVGAASRNKGKRAEVEVVHALRRAGWAADTSRNVTGGRQRGADLVTTLPYVVEVKDHAKLDLPGFWRQAVEQAQGDVPLLVVKRRQFAHAEDWWAIQDLRTCLYVASFLPEVLPKQQEGGIVH